MKTLFYKMMRLKLLLLLLAFTAISCKEEIKPKKEKAVLDTVASDTTVIPNLSEFKGFWLSEKYVNALRQYKSVSKAMDAYNEQNTVLIGFQISRDDVSDQRVNFIGFAISEGGFGGMLYLNQASGRLYHIAGKYIIPDEDVTLALRGKDKLDVHYASGEVFTYVHYPGKSQDDMEAIINSLLFEGSYKDLATGKKIVFSANGTVTGFEDTREYSPLYQFDESEPYGPDAIYLYRSLKTGDYDFDYTEGNYYVYDYEFRADTLLLYKPRPEYIEHPYTGNPADTLRILKHRLVKQ